MEQTVIVTDRVRYVETDMMGVVHHSNYLHWFEMGRVEYLKQAGIDLNELAEQGILYPIIDVHCQYKQSARFDDQYEIHVTLTAFSRAKLCFSYRIIRTEDGAVLAVGETTNVFADANGRIVRLPDDVFQRLQTGADHTSNKTL